MTVSSAIKPPIPTDDETMTTGALAQRFFFRRSLPAVLALTLSSLVLPALFLTADATPEENRNAPSGMVVPQAGLGSGRLDPLLHGSNWRQLWNTPIVVPMLDLRTFAGGLRPMEERGDHLSKQLLLQGGDGKRYLFVPLEREPARGLAPNLRAG